MEKKPKRQFRVRYFPNEAAISLRIMRTAKMPVIVQGPPNVDCGGRYVRVLRPNGFYALIPSHLFEGIEEA